MSDRIGALSAKLARIADARQLTQTPVWADAWRDCEQELLERLLACSPDEEMARYKLQEAIKAVRQVRRAIERGASGEKALRDELDILEGRKSAPIA